MKKTVAITARRRTNFLTEIVEADLAAGRNGGRVVTRFPPEPNGFLHIRHAKSIFLNFGLAQQYGGLERLQLEDALLRHERQEQRLEHGNDDQPCEEADGRGAEFDRQQYF